MSTKNTSPVRSWMVVYVAFVAAFVLAGEPVDVTKQDVVSLPTSDAVPVARMLRVDM